VVVDKKQPFRAAHKYTIARCTAADIIPEVDFAARLAVASLR
jgi:hypothetical protein